MVKNSNARVLELTLRGYADAASSATVQILSFDRRTRVRRAVQGLAASWVAATIAVFIPIAHFLLVPAFFALGLYFLFRNLRVKEAVTEARGACPDCGLEQELEVSGNWDPPHRITCRGCQRSLLLSSS
jgi:hypothetical protein